LNANCSVAHHPIGGGGISAAAGVPLGPGRAGGGFNLGGERRFYRERNLFRTPETQLDHFKKVELILWR